jgi:pimeloyl-ACP methyl ester carboxylesterase
VVSARLLGVPGVEPSRSGFVEVNRTRLRVWEWGDEAHPAVLLAHGAYDHGRMWDGIAPRLAAMGHRVVAPDLRGHGDSGRLGSGAMWATSALDLAMLARRLGPPIGVVGHSFGGGQAMYAAGVWPELFRWVVNLDGLGPPAEAFTENDLVEMAHRSVESATRVLGQPPRRYASIEQMVERRQGVNVRLPAEWTRHLVVHGSRPDGDGWVWKADPLFGVGFPGDFDLDHLHAEHELVTAPVLVLTGAEHDTWSDLSAAELDERLSHLRAGRHQVIADAGHYVHVEQPDAVVAAIAAFVDDADGGGPVVGAATVTATPSPAILPTVAAVPAPARTAPFTERAIAVVHQFGDERAGAPWRAALEAVGWPGPVVAPDLPGHGTSPAPVGGSYEQGDLLLALLRALVDVGLADADADAAPPVVVGCGVGGWPAHVLALAGRASALVLVDGLGGPWSTPRQQVAAWRVALRVMADDDAAMGPPPAADLDPRARLGLHGNGSRRLAVRAAAATTVPVLVVESPASALAGDDVDALAAGFAAGATVRRVADAGASTCVPVIAEWVAETLVATSAGSSSRTS